MQTDDTWKSPHAVSPEDFARIERELDVKTVEPAGAKGGGGGPRRPRKAVGGDLPRDPWPIALHLRGLLGQHLGGGKWAVLCINDAQHSNPDQTAERAGGSCALLPPTDGHPYTLPICKHSHCAHLRLSHWRAAIGEELWQRAAEMARDGDAPAPAPASVDGTTEPPVDAPAPALGIDLGDHIAKAADEKKPGLLFERRALEAAVTMEDEDPASFSIAVDAAKAIEGFKLTAWRKAIDGVRRARKRAANDAKRAQERADAAARREERERQKVALQAEREARRRTAESDRQEHHREATVDEVTYFMEPGRTWMETTVHPGTDRERVVVDTLCEFSAVLAEVLMDIDSPDAKPRPTVYVLSVCRLVGSPFRIEVSSEQWGAGNWHELHIARPGLGAYGRATREHVRRAIEAMSPSPSIRYRYRFIGWARHEGRPVYLNADLDGGGAIDARGNVPGLRAEPPVDRCNRFRLPALEDLDVKRDVGAMIYLLGHEPVQVFAVFLGFTVRAAMGGARSVAHLTGRSGLGKSETVAVFAQCFGPSFSRREPLLSWRARGATVQGMVETMSCARDVLLQIDDLQRTPESIGKCTAVVPMHFEGTGQIKGKARGGSLALNRSQGVIASSGETLPDEPSVRNRVEMLDLDVHPTPRLDVGPDCASARGARGELARGMAGFIRWWAAKYDEQLPKLPQLERDAARRWALGSDGRAAEVLGPAALGLDAFFRFAQDAGAATEEEVAAMRARATLALREAASVHVAHVAEEAHWRRYLDLIAQALRSGQGHALRGRRSGNVFSASDAPDDPTLWGWRTRKSTTATNEEPRTTVAVESQGLPIAYLHDEKPGLVLLAPGPSLRLVLDLARDEGRPLHLDVSALARELLAAGVLADVSKGRAVGRKKWSWGSGDVEGFELRVAALWGDDEPPADREPGEEG